MIAIGAKRALLGIIILSAFAYFVLPASGASPDKGSFVTLGQAIKEGDGPTRVKDEMVNLLSRPDTPDVICGQLKSGTTVVVLQKVELEAGKAYYQVSTFGRDGGMIGWVSSDYIYEILPGPPEE